MLFRSIVFETESEQEAFDYEVQLIARYGRDQLVNQTNGGQGVSGRVTTEETKKKIGTKNRARYSTPEERKRLSEKAKAQMADVEAQEKLQAAQRQYLADPERRKRALEKRRATTSAPGYIRTPSIPSEEGRQRISAARKAYLAVPEHREALRRRAIEQAQRQKIKRAI